MKEEVAAGSSSAILCLTKTRIHLEREDSLHVPGGSTEVKSSNSDDTAKGQYVAISPDGAKIQIPKELFVSLVDFMRTRRSPGSITIQFRAGEIVSVEAIAKKTYHS
jgi:hypothetical protein